MPWKNIQYHGQDVLIKLMRTTNMPWQIKSIRNGYLISNAQYRERYQPAMLSNNSSKLFAPLDTDTSPIFSGCTERELRNLHSQCSRKSSNPIQTPYSKYVSMTSSMQDTSWGEGAITSIIFKFDIWRSDVWKGKHELTRDPMLLQWLISSLLSLPVTQRLAILSEQTPPDWDRGTEFEWLALGGTKIYRVLESTDGTNWQEPPPTGTGIDFWWESL